MINMHLKNIVGVTHTTYISFCASILIAPSNLIGLWTHCARPCADVAKGPFLPWKLPCSRHHLLLKHVAPPTQPSKDTFVILCSTPHPRKAMGAESLMQISRRQRHHSGQAVISFVAAAMVILTSWVQLEWGPI